MSYRTSNSKVLQAPVESVWAVLADFGAVSTWNPAISNSYSTGDLNAGLGASRHCDLAPLGSTEESITGWEPHKQLVVTVDSATKVPFKTGRMIFDLEPKGDTTEVTMAFEYEPKGGPMSGMIGRRMEKRLASQMITVLDGLEAGAHEAAAAK